MSNRRLLRVADLLRETLSEIIFRTVHDPRVTGRDFAILRVDVSSDLNHARVHISSLLAEKERNELLDGLNHSAGYIHHELMREVRLKNTPALLFVYDDGIERSQRITDILNSLHKEGA